MPPEEENEEKEEEVVEWEKPPYFLPGQLIEYRLINIYAKDLEYLKNEIDKLKEDVEKIKQHLGIS
ncbi:MAG: hypothetical protein LM587_02655 [Candidatus Aenigmarchaeota archaeon]|nr:hypothetical protein [Candidatus Aenigmarchaeota archaeon]